jgi:protein-tyrosine-phosphatase
MFSIVYVCTGNTCRSPMAEGILRKLLEESGVDNVDVSSAGIGTLDGYPATHHAVEISARNQIDIAGHHSTRMTEQVFRQADLVFALSHNHYDFLKDLPGSSAKLFMVKAFPMDNNANPANSIDDPVGGSLEEYKVTFEEIQKEIKRALPDIVRRIANNHQAS